MISPLTIGRDLAGATWGVPGEEDADLGVADYVCDELHWAVRETLRASGQASLTMAGWCIGAALAAIYTALHPDGPVRNLAVLTMPHDTHGSLYSSWVGREAFDVKKVANAYEGVPGNLVDRANKFMKPVTNYVTTRRKLFESASAGTANRVAYQSMAKWVGDNPRFPAAAFSDWITWVYKENRLAKGTLRLRGRLVDYAAIPRQSVLVVTAAADHIAPREGTLPFLNIVTTDDLTYLDRPGGHIGLDGRVEGPHPDLAGYRGLDGQALRGLTPPHRAGRHRYPGAPPLSIPLRFRTGARR